MSSYKVHNVRFFGLSPRAGNGMAYSRSRKCLAVSRSDSSIEIWNFSVPNSPLLERCIPGKVTLGSVEALAWAGENGDEDKNERLDSDSEEEEGIANGMSKPEKRKGKENLRYKHKRKDQDRDRRLFSTGLHGLVIEHDLDHVDVPSDRRTSEKVQIFWPVTAGAAWCMKFNSNAGKLAVGTEEGYVSTFDVVKGGLNIDRVLDKQEGRVLCLDWHCSGSYIVTGSTDTIRMWDVKSGHPLMRMSTGRTMKHVETTVWSVVLLENMTVVSGDSRGKTCFWNGRTGTLMDGYQTHKADVLTVATNDDHSEVFSSGVDPVVMHFQPIQKGQLDMNATRQTVMPRWVKSSHRFSHTHDVRAVMSIGDRKVASIGVDTNLVVYDSPSRTITKYPPVPDGTNVVVCPESGTIALRHDDRVELWKLGDGQGNSSSQKQVPLVRSPVKLLDLKTCRDSIIANFDVTPDSTFVSIVTTDENLRIFRVEFNDDGVPSAVRKVRFERPDASRNLSRYNLVRLQKTDSRCHLFVSTVGGTLLCFDVNSNPCEVMWSLDAHELKLSTGIKSFAVHKDHCLLTDFSNGASVLDLRSLSDPSPSVQKLPTSDRAPISAAAFNPFDGTILIVYSDHRIVEYAAGGERLTDFSRCVANKSKCLLPLAWLAKKLPTTGIIFPRNDVFLLYDTENICTFDRTKLRNETSGKPAKSLKASKGKQIFKPPTNETDLDSAMKVTKKYRNLIFVGDLGGSELVAVEDKPQHLESRLPPSLRQKKFGAM